MGDVLKSGIETLMGRDGPHIPGRSLRDHAGDVVGVLLEGVTNRVEIVVGDHDGVTLGHAW